MMRNTNSNTNTNENSNDSPIPWRLFISIYTTQYIGVAFIFASAVAILRQQGMALDKLAWINIIALPLACKIFYAPFIDRYRLAIIQGQYRSWLLVAQAVMTGLLVIIGKLDMVGQFHLALGLLLLYAFATSVQDVAIDGLACKLVSPKKRQFANSIQYASNLLGNVIGGGVILMLYHWLQWQGSFTLLAIATSISWIQLYFFKEPTLTPTAKLIQPIKSASKSSNFSTLFSQIRLFIRQWRGWFGLLLVYPIGFSTAFALLNPLLVDAGWALADIGFVTKVVGSLVGIISAISASMIISRYGRQTALIALTGAQAVALIMLLPLALGDTRMVFVYGAVIAYFAINPALLATLSTLMMDKASQTDAKATFFTLQISCISVMGFIYAGLGLVLAKNIGYLGVLMMSIVLTLALAVSLKFYCKTMVKTKHYS
ncbi:MFS transporter [Psychrobacter sp. I-STPA10]|uniref:MFS transporter n=1 Tax=Psychrobacter sp. I-STPA10 TaxID=2585769 RepID=UPI001E4BA838|nr:MFS transporter [Psychrobacter sp. I-STPA10]